MVKKYDRDGQGYPKSYEFCARFFYMRIGGKET